MLIKENYPDISYTVEATLGDNNLFINFKVYEIIGEDTRLKINPKLYYAIKNSINNDDVTENLEEAKIYLSGTIKWDGCSNLHFDEQDDVMLHFCSKNDIKNLGVLLEKLYEIAAKMMPNHEENLV